MNKVLFYTLLMVGAVQAAQQETSTESFIKSFVREYDFSNEGRYTHEYHSFLLKQTRKSLEKFESFLKDSGFDCVGRRLIMGYQKEGVPSYYSSLNAVSLTDEASLSGQRGRIVPAHNIFGFLTGFVLKDVNWLQQQWFSGKAPIIEHIGSQDVELFDDQAYLFQKHAFGDDFELLLNQRKRIEKAVKTAKIPTVLTELVSFWESMYRGDLKNCSQEMLATQDILFSIDYAKHITHSSIPVSNWYLGPDITYPIELLSFQGKEATACAQRFVEQFSATLQPVAGKKTAYVFCSFVDGVGKSTLLGNVINWSKYKTNVDQYERVDNSSSQTGVLYDLGSDVFIMDLPAQLSHWVVKPDGHVFVDIDCVRELAAERSTFQAYVIKHQKQLTGEFGKILMNLGKAEAEPLSGFLADYVENLVLFAPEELWIPFTYGDRFGIFKETDATKIRILAPLEGVHSKGLKVAQPEQMIFSNGVKIPMQFDAFMADVAAQFTKAGIEKLVFVDFLSMYPRSSRENVRVTFLLQQMKKIYQQGFSLQESVYHPFVNREVELYHALSKGLQPFMLSLMIETATRASLYSIFAENSGQQLTSVSSSQITQLLTERNEKLFKEEGKFLFEEVRAKLEAELNHLKQYARDNRYEVFTQFSTLALYAFSQIMEQIFEAGIANASFNSLWQGMTSGQVTTEYATTLSTGVAVQQLGQIADQCHDPLVLTPLLPTIRAQWFATLTNFLCCQLGNDGRLHVGGAYCNVPPLVVKPGIGQTFLLLQKELDFTEKNLSSEQLQLAWTFGNYNAFDKQSLTEFEGVVYCSNWHGIPTNWGIYTFAQDDYYKIIDKLLDQRKKEGFKNPIIYSSELLKELEQQGILKELTKKWEALTKEKSMKVASDSAHGRAIAFWVRAVATLDMIAKDPKAVIVTRTGNKEDFAATLQLVERCTLPRYFSIQLDKPLFEDYTKVEPLIPWEYIYSDHVPAYIS